jgi:hypothetical protein
LDLAGQRTEVLNSRILDNFTAKEGGGVYGPHVTLYNSLIADNRVTDATLGTGGGVYLSTAGALNNCTVAGNSASVSAGGLYIGGTGVATNSILYHNTAPAGTNYVNAAGDTGLTYCCVTPAVTGTGNLDTDPLFRNAAAGDYRLLGSSPCINAGVELAWMSGATDLDGNPRVDLQFDKVDLGCYEKVFHSTMIMVR